MNSINIRYMEGLSFSLSTKIGGPARPLFANCVARILIAPVEKQTGRGASMDGLREHTMVEQNVPILSLIRRLRRHSFSCRSTSGAITIGAWLAGQLRVQALEIAALLLRFGGAPGSGIGSGQVERHLRTVR